MLQLEAWRFETFGGLAGSIDRRAYWAGMKSFKDETELSVLQSLLTGAMWTASTDVRQYMRPSLVCPYYPGCVQETERHILWDCPRHSTTGSPRSGGS